MNTDFSFPSDIFQSFPIMSFDRKETLKCAISCIALPCYYDFHCYSIICYSMQFYLLLLTFIYLLTICYAMPRQANICNNIRSYSLIFTHILCYALSYYALFLCIVMQNNSMLFETILSCLLMHHHIRSFIWLFYPMQCHDMLHYLMIRESSSITSTCRLL